MSRQNNEVIQQRIITATNYYSNYLNNSIILINKLSMLLINKLNMMLISNLNMVFPL
jgi:hypothetical protein